MRRLNIFLFFALFLASIIGSGCKTKKDNINIDVVLTKLNNNEAGLNEDVTEMLMPFKQDDVIYLPQGDILHPSDTISYIKAKSWVDRLRNKISENTSEFVLKKQISKHLNSITLSSLSSKKMTNPDYIEKVTKYYDNVLIYSPSLKEINLPDNATHFKKTGKLKHELQEQVNQYKGKKNLIVYKFPFDGKDKNGPGIKIDKGPNQTSSNNESNFNKEKIKSYIHQILEEPNTNAQKKKVKEIIANHFAGPGKQVEILNKRGYHAETKRIENFLKENIILLNSEFSIKSFELNSKGKVSKLTIQLSES